MGIGAVIVGHSVHRISLFGLGLVGIAILKLFTLDPRAFALFLSIQLFCFPLRPNRFRFHQKTAKARVSFAGLGGFPMVSLFPISCLG